MIAELYVCKNCEHIELELNDSCPECGGELVCTDFVPSANPIETRVDEITGRYIAFWVRVPGYGLKVGGGDWHPVVLLKTQF